MASPALQTMCCLFVNGTDTEQDDDWETVITTYNVMCIISSSLSIIGAIYQLVPRAPKQVPRTRREIDGYKRQNTIIIWLAIADLLAVLCILTRSSVWLSGFTPWSDDDTPTPDGANLFCAVFSAFIQYFYVLTYFWTFFYAFDIYRYVHDKRSHQMVYHLISWFVPIIICLAGLLPVYLPNLQSCRSEFPFWLPHYVLTYAPIVVVMVMLPILYVLSAIKVKGTLRGRGLYTDHERKVVSTTKTKFFSVTLVFYLCWSPNVINGILLLFFDSIPLGVYYALWHFMAVLNPMQAFLNSLVYRGSGSCQLSWPEGVRTRFTDAISTPFTRKRKRDIQHASTTDLDESADDETSPLLFYRK